MDLHFKIFLLFQKINKLVLPLLSPLTESDTHQSRLTSKGGAENFLTFESKFTNG